MSLTEQELAEVRNLISVKNIVRRSENPHPVIVAFIIFVIILAVYCMYVHLVKRSITGEWDDDDDNKHTISHNKWRNFIIIDKKYRGLINDRLIIIYMNGRMQMGIVTSNAIKWMNGSIWHKVLA